MTPRAIWSRTCWFVAIALFGIACYVFVAGLLGGDMSFALWTALPTLWVSATSGAIGLVLIPPRLDGATTFARSLAVAATLLVPLVMGLPIALVMLLFALNLVG